MNKKLFVTTLLAILAAAAVIIAAYAIIHLANNAHHKWVNWQIEKRECAAALQEAFHDTDLMIQRWEWDKNCLHTLPTPYYANIARKAERLDKVLKRKPFRIPLTAGERKQKASAVKDGTEYSQKAHNATWENSGTEC